MFTYETGIEIELVRSRVNMVNIESEMWKTDLKRFSKMQGGQR